MTASSSEHGFKAQAVEVRKAAREFMVEHKGAYEALADETEQPTCTCRARIHNLDHHEHGCAVFEPEQPEGSPDDAVGMVQDREDGFQSSTPERRMRVALDQLEADGVVFSAEAANFMLDAVRGRPMMARPEETFKATMPEPGTECPTCQQQVVASVSWVRHSHEDICAAEKKTWYEATERAVRIVEAQRERYGAAFETTAFDTLIRLLRGGDDA